MATEEEELDIEFDWTSGYPSLHISFILSQVAPLRHVVGNDVFYAKKATEECVKASFKDKKDIRIELVGGAFEGFVMPQYQSKAKINQGEKASTCGMIAVPMSILVNYNKSDDDRYVIEDKKTQLGYVRIEVPEAIQASINNEFLSPSVDKVYLSSAAMQADMLKKLNLDQESKRKERILVYTKSDNDFADLEEPATIGLQCVKWPKAAEEWKTRTRRSGWPSKEVIDDVSKEPCLVVPGAHPKSVAKSTEWKYSFAIPERVLFSHMTDIQKQCFVLFRIFKKQSLSFPDLLSDYQIKTLILWTCEKIPPEEWTYDNMGTFFVYLIDYLLECVINLEMPHYFMPKCNILEDLTEDFQDELMVKLAHLRTGPMQPFYEFTQQNDIPYLPQTKPLKDVLAIIEDNKAFDDIRKLYSKQLQCMENLGKILMEESKLDEAMANLKLHSKTYQELTKQVIDPGTSLSSFALHSSTDKAIEVYEYLLRTEGESESKYHYLGNLGCMYHSKYATSEGDIQKEYRQKADATFMEALSASGASDSTRMDYCNYLYHLEENDKALPILDEIVQNQGKLLEGNMRKLDGNSYGVSEEGTVDSNLQQEIEQTNGGDITVLAYTYAQYIKVQILRKQGKITEAKKCLDDFLTTCVILDMKEFHLGYRTMSWSLYAYAAKDLELYKEALQGFKSVIKLNAKHLLARQNKDECTAMLMSLYPDEALDDDPNEETGNLNPVTAKPEEHSFKPPSDMAETRQLHFMLACTSDDRKRAEYQEQAHAKFNATLSSQSASIVARMDYANFLYDIQKYDKAMQELDIILADQKSKTGSLMEVTAYTKLESCIVKDSIKQEFTVFDYIEMPVYMYAFYLMIKCLQAQKKIVEANQLLSQMKGELERIVRALPESQTVMSYKLVAFAAQDLEDFTSAIAAFDKILAIQPRNLQVQQKKQQCEEQKLPKSGKKDGVDKEPTSKISIQIPKDLNQSGGAGSVNEWLQQLQSRVKAADEEQGNDQAKGKPKEDFCDLDLD